MFLRFHSLDTYRAMNIVIEEDPSTNEGALWLGDYTAATDLMMLKQKNIRSVLTVASGLNVSYPAIANIIHKVCIYCLYQSRITSSILKVPI
jgi:hypothetical protein